MNKLLIVGSIAFDDVKTPFGKVKKALGGSAVYASIAASFFTTPTIVGVVGKDFSKKHIELLQKHNVNTSGIKKLPGKTFHWKGFYSYDLNNAQTIETQLNVFASFNPQLDENLKNSQNIFLGNIDPELQYSVYKQTKSPSIVACDTMNFWIENKLNDLKKLLKFMDIMFINESEIRQLTKEYNIIKASKIVQNMGPKVVIVKRGEYGAICFFDEHIFTVPSYPLENVFDPTGAGDSFAGGVMGFLSTKKKITQKIFRQAIIFGTITASFCVESFSINKLYNVKYENILNRYREIKKLVHFENIK
ncbi:MAG: PfkB family carbohydrate kinase [Endomicrobia bacterium]|nr:PfkB family carbohydrate kinase [Endomicrobiia bacterium]